MTIQFNKETNLYDVKVSLRHPSKNVPYRLQRNGLKSRAEATRKEAELKNQLHRQFAKTQKPTWETICVQYLESCRLADYSAKTVFNTQSILANNTYALWGKRQCHQIPTVEIKALVKESLAEKSNGHKRNVLKAVKAVFNYAVEEGILDRNPTPQLKIKVGERMHGCLTEHEVRDFLELAKKLYSPWYYHWCLAIYTGMRSGELYALRWSKVNFDTRLITVDEAWNSKAGFKSTKSGNDRVLEIAPTLLTVLKELKLKSPHENEFVLPRIRDWERGEQARELRKFLIGMGLAPMRFHDLRASCATILLSKGVEPIKVMKMGGWQDMKTMMKYVRKAGVDIRGATDCLNLHSPHFTEAQIIPVEFGTRLN